MAETIAKIKNGSVMNANTSDTDGLLVNTLLEALTSTNRLNVGAYGRSTRSATNYTAATQSIDDHLAGIDTVLGSGPAAHLMGSSSHTTDSLANLNNKVTGGSLDFSTASRPPNGTATGDLGNSYPNPSVLKVHNDLVDTDTPTTGDVWQWNGSEWHQQPVSKVRAYLSSNFSVADNSWDRIDWSAETFDFLGEFASSRFTANEAGYYAVNIHVTWQGTITGKDFYLALHRSGTAIAIQTQHRDHGTTFSQSINDLVYLTASQYLEAWVLIAYSGFDILNGINSWFAVHRVL